MNKHLLGFFAVGKVSKKMRNLLGAKQLRNYILLNTICGQLLAKNFLAPIFNCLWTNYQAVKRDKSSRVREQMQHVTLKLCGNWFYFGPLARGGVGLYFLCS